MKDQKQIGIVRRHRVWAAIALALTLSLVLAACGGSNSAPAAPAGSSGPKQTAGGSVAANPSEGAQQAKTSGSTQTSEGGAVTVEVTWGGRNAGPVFQVAMDTHSVDLDGYDLAKLAVLRTDNGQEVKPSSWDAPKGGHHRSGTLTFPAQASDGSPLIGPNTRTIELVIRGVAGVPERVFRWTP